MRVRGAPRARGPSRPRAGAAGLRLLAAALLGAAAALLVSCSGSGKGLIPSAQAGPLARDFLLVEAAARAGHGNCAATEAALQKTESDFAALPASVDAGLRRRLRDGIAKLREDALELCAQPPTQATTTTAPRTTTSTQPATTPTTTTTTTQTTPSTPTAPANPNGGTPAGEGEEAESGKGKGNGNGGEHAREPGSGGGGPAPSEGGK